MSETGADAADRSTDDPVIVDELPFPDYPDIVEELRLSVVLYGGVSLAIYMTGVCEELLNMVRATHRPPDGASSRVPSGGHQQYRTAAKVTPTELATGELELPNTETLDDLASRPICRKFIVDVLSGSSAGGLNAIYLARALVGDLDVASIKRLFVEEADIVRLLNDDLVTEPLPWSRPRDDGRVHRMADAPAVRPTEPPKSLLSSDRFSQLLLHALYDQGDPGSSLVGSLDCYMTMTDLRGTPVESRLNDGSVVSETLHRTVAHLQYGTRESYGARRNDFFGVSVSPVSKRRSEVEPFLAFVGRSTAAHPAAFFPAQLNQLARVLPKSIDFDPLHERWSSLLTPVYPPVDLPRRWFSDGGGLDNKPFTHAIDPVIERRSVISVDRKIVYVEPDPSEIDESWQETRMPDLGDYTVGAFSLGRKEGIREDLARIERRNQVVAELRSALGDILGDLPTASVAIKMDTDLADNRRVDRRKQIDKWIDAAERHNQKAPHNQQTPHELARHRSVVHELTDWAARVSEAAPARIGAVIADALPANHRRVLIGHDIGYRLRRLNLFDQVLAAFQQPAPDGSDPVKQWRDHPIPDLENRQLRSDLNAIYIRLMALTRELELRLRWESNSVLEDGHAIREQLQPCVKALQVALDADDETAVLSALRRLLEIRRSVVERVLESASLEARTLLFGFPDAEWRQRFTSMWERFDHYDVLLLPLFEETRGEIDPIEIVRVSPKDATSLVSGSRSKLGGAGVHHFGGFLDLDWRRCDMLWGRLDAAELLIKLMLPVRTSGERSSSIATLRAGLIRKAQIEILREERASFTSLARVSKGPRDQIGADTAPDAVHEFLRKKFDVDLSLNSDPSRSQVKATILGRGSEIVGRVIAGRNVDPYEQKRSSFRSTSATVRSGLVANAIVQLAAPSARTSRFIRYFALPAMVVAPLYAVVLAYGDDDRRWLAIPAISLALLLLTMSSALRAHGSAPVTEMASDPGSETGSETVTARTRVRSAVRHVVRLVAAGIMLVPLAWTTLPDSGRAWWYSILALFIVVAAGWTFLSGGIRSPTLRGVLGTVFVVVAIATIASAARLDWRAATIVLCGLFVSSVIGGLYCVLAMMQGSLDLLGEPPGRSASPDRNRTVRP